MAQAVVDGREFFKNPILGSMRLKLPGRKPDENGEVVQRVPYGNPVDPPREGNRLLNLEKVEAWLKEVHKIHEEKEWDGYPHMVVRKMVSKL